MESLLLIHWNRSTGPEIIIQYPPSKKFPTKDTFLKIWAQHELNKENSMIELEVGNGTDLFKYISVLHDYENEIYFLVLIYNKETYLEAPSPDILVVIGNNLLELMNTNKITRAVSEAFTTINNYSKHESENLINFFQDKIKFTILQILEEGVISKTELIRILREEYGFSTINIDLLLVPFIQENLIQKKIIAGSNECYLLIKDLTYARIPPQNLPHEIEDEKMLKKYKSELIHFFSRYDFNEEIKNKSLTGFLIDKDVYNLIMLLRNKVISVNECLNTLNNREDLFSELLDSKILFEGKGFVYLLSDLRFILFSPLFIIEKLRVRYAKNQITLNQYYAHLKMLLRDLKEKLNYTII
jgi:hypothetical protein